MTKIYIINLERSLERRQQISAQLENMNVEFQFFQATDGKKEPNHPLFEKYNKHKSIERRGKALNLGQLGCYASHYRLWELCIKSNEDMIIIEDDTIFNDNLFVDFLKSTPKLTKEIECVRLFKNKRKRYTSVPYKNFGNIHIHKFNKGHMSATGYFITPSAAKKFIEKSQEWYLPVDILMDMFWENKVECFGLVPECLVNDVSLDSNINTEKSSNKRPLTVRVKREIYKFRDEVMRVCHNSLFCLRRLL